MRDLQTSMLAFLVLTDIQSRAVKSAAESILDARARGRQHVATDGGRTTDDALNDAWKAALQSELTESVQAVAELINARMARIVVSRGDVHSTLPFHDFWQAFSDSWQFVLDCEVVCKKMIVGLRGVVVGQVRNTARSIKFCSY